MKALKKLLLIPSLAILMMSCEEIFFEKDEVNDPVSNFDYLWTNMSQRYSLFEFKNIDWDSAYSVYRPRVQASTQNDELFAIMAEMLNSLRDGHTNLRAPMDISRYFPYLEYPQNFDYSVVERNYLRDFRFTGFLLNQVIGDVGYIYYRSFATPIKDWELDTVINRFTNAGVRGVIIDIRDNEGGNPENGLLMLSRMIDQRTHIYTSQQKNGPGRDDFATPQEIFLDPNDEDPHFPGQVIVLTNRKVYSAGSYFSAAVKAIPDVLLMGDTTGGGSGVPAGFELPNGWACNYSSTIGTLVTGENFEGGVPPDITVALDTFGIRVGIDTIIEAALNEIRNQ